VSPWILLFESVKNTFYNICKFVCRKLTEITNSVVKGVVTVVREIGTLLRMWWESWKEEITEVIKKI
jgi:hypothetical protein